MASQNQKVDPYDLSAGVPGIEGELSPKPKLSDRISMRVFYVAFGFCGVLVVIFLMALDNMDNKKAAPPEKKAAAAKEREESSGTPKELLGISATPSAGEAAGATPASVIKAPVSASATVAPGSVPSIANMGSFPKKGAIPSKQDMPANAELGATKTPVQQAEEQAKLNRMARMTQARTNGLSAAAFDVGGGVPPAVSPGVEAIKSALAQAGGNGAGQAQAAQQKPGPDGEQDEKLEFVKNAAKDNRGYLPHMPRPALSPDEVKAGTFIHLSLEQGINSDLPGQVTARVTEDVYDTITGCRLLIPAMSKAIGKYDSKVALGQGRNLVVWNSMIFKDGAELNLAGMQAYDTAGMAGMEADVDNHYLRTFGLTFGMSVLTAGTQMSVPPPPPPPANGGTVQPTFQQSLATALAQQYGQLGAQMLGKYMAVQPTLRNYPGERFTIMVPHSIMFEKIWRNRCDHS